MIKIGCVVSEIIERTNRQTDRQTDEQTHDNTLHCKVAKSYTVQHITESIYTVSTNDVALRNVLFKIHLGSVNDIVTYDDK